MSIACTQHSGLQVPALHGRLVQGFEDSCAWPRFDGLVGLVAVTKAGTGRGAVEHAIGLERKSMRGLIQPRDLEQIAHCATRPPSRQLNPL